MNRRGFLRALGFGLPAAAACAALQAPGKGAMPAWRFRARRDLASEWREVPEVIYVKLDAPVHGIRVVQSAPASVWGVTDASIFPKA